MASSLLNALELGQDVTAVARPCGVDPTHLPVGSLVGVKRTNGAVTVGRVETPLHCTPAGHIHVALGEDRTRKDVPPGMIYSLPTAAPPPAVALPALPGRSASGGLREQGAARRPPSCLFGLQ
jgi:hypothetical protein